MFFVNPIIFVQKAVKCPHMLAITTAIIINSYYNYWPMVGSQPELKKQWDETSESYWMEKGYLHININNIYYRKKFLH